MYSQNAYSQPNAPGLNNSGARRPNASQNIGRSSDERSLKVSSIMEEENDEKISIMRQKVAHLKRIGQNLQTEIQESNSFLSRMTDNFNDADSMLGTTVRKLKATYSHMSGGGHMWWLMIFVVILIFVMYLVYRHGGK